jgi:hypothetical protein
MSRKYSPNHPAVMSHRDTYFSEYSTPQNLNSPYRLPLFGFALSIFGGVVAISYLPTVAVFGFPFAFIWAAPFVAGAMACFSRCLTLLEQEKKRG